LQQDQIRKLKEFKSRRDSAKLTASLAAIRETAAKPEGNENNLMVPIKEAVKNYATIGEIFRTLKEVFGEHRQG
jgi:methylmalonyl-CoA mutase N-terminal domain/subunit